MSIKNSFDEQIIHLKEVDSTNNHASYLIDNQQDAGVLCGKIIFADYQTHGRGAYQNMWLSECCKNILVSFIVCPDITPKDQFYISKIISLSLVDFFAENDVKAQIKWPNDILVSYKKISGILIENSIQGNKINHSIVGVGVNINQTVFPNGLKATSLKKITGKEYYNLLKLVKNLWLLFEKYSNLYKIQGYQAIDKKYFENLIGTEKFMRYKADGKEFEARITDIDEFGRLIVKDKTGDEKIFGFKEVEIIL